MGIPWLVNAAGALIIGRKHVEQVLCGEKGDKDLSRKLPNIKVLNEYQGDLRQGDFGARSTCHIPRRKLSPRNARIC